MIWSVIKIKLVKHDEETHWKHEWCMRYQCHECCCPMLRVQQLSNSSLQNKVFCSLNKTPCHLWAVKAPSSWSQLKFHIIIHQEKSALMEDILVKRSVRPASLQADGVFWMWLCTQGQLPFVYIILHDTVGSSFQLRTIIYLNITRWQSPLPRDVHVTCPGYRSLHKAAFTYRTNLVYQGDNICRETTSVERQHL